MYTVRRNVHRTTNVVSSTRANPRIWHFRITVLHQDSAKCSNMARSDNLYYVVVSLLYYSSTISRVRCNVELSKLKGRKCGLPREEPRMARAPHLQKPAAVLPS